MTGLMMLQHMEGLSDERVVEKWVENPYWQYFCGYDFLQWEMPIDPSSLTRWRKRIGEEGLEKILSATLRTALAVKVAKPKDFEKVIVDTTVMEENIMHPTDSALLNKARSLLVKKAVEEGIVLRQSYTRVGAYLTRKVSRYAHAKQYKRMKKGIKKLKVYLGRVMRDIDRKATDEQKKSFQGLWHLSEKLLRQEKKSRDKIYSLHAPHTYCVSKGKARTPYEFGVKVSLVVSHKQGLALSSQALEKSLYDGHTLKDSLEKAQEIAGIRPQKSFVDKGYKGHKVHETEVYISAQRKGLTKSLKRDLKRRSAIEPHIGHMKAEGKLGRNYLKGMVGAKLNALLCAIGHNLRLILNHLKDILIFIWHIIFQNYSPMTRSLHPPLTPNIILQTRRIRRCWGVCNGWMREAPMMDSVTPDKPWGVGEAFPRWGCQLGILSPKVPEARQSCGVFSWRQLLIATPLCPKDHPNTILEKLR